MPDAKVGITVSEPVSAIVSAAAQVFVAVLQYGEKIRETASPSARDEQDHIASQVYWDWRAFLHSLGIVGDALPWPNPNPPQPPQP